jgi:hypothetical protein
MLLDIIGQPFTTQITVGTNRLLKEGCPIMSSFSLGEDWVPVPDLTYVSYERLPASWEEDEPVAWKRDKLDSPVLRLSVGTTSDL